MRRHNCWTVSAAIVVLAMAVLGWAGARVMAGEAPAGGEARAAVEMRLSAIEKEVARLREARKEAESGVLARKLQYFRDRLEGKVKSAEEGAELHVVGVHESLTDAGRPGTVVVEVQATDRPVVVALCSYNKNRWELQLAQGAKVQKIIVGGYHDQRLENPPPGVAVEVHTADGRSRQHFHAYKKDYEGYPRVVTTLKTLTELNVMTFQGSYKYPGQPFVIGPANAEWMAQRVLAEIEPVYREATAFDRARQRESLRPLRFKAIQFGPDPRNLGVAFMRPAELGDFTPCGPIAITFQPLPDRVTQVATDPTGPTDYGIDNHSVYRIDLKGRQKLELPIKDFDLPELSWACGLAFDTKRGRLVLASLGGEGFLYAYAPLQNKWTLISSLRNVDLMALAYSSEQDCLYGLSMPFGGNREMTIHQYDAQGTVTRQVGLSEQLPMNRPGPGAGFQMACVGRQLAVLTPPVPDPATTDAAEHSWCYLIDPQTGKVMFKGVMEPQADIGAAPLAAEEMEKLWETLKGEDRAASEGAMWRLAGGGDASVAFLKGKFRPVVKRDPQRVAALIAQLDQEDFRARERASEELAKMGPAVEGELLKALEGELSLEAKTRLEATLKRIGDLSAGKSPDELADPEARQEARAVVVLARIGTPVAIDCLKELAAGTGVVRAGQARAALGRVGKR